MLTRFWGFLIHLPLGLGVIYINHVEGVKNTQKFNHVVYEWPPDAILVYLFGLFFVSKYFSAFFWFIIRRYFCSFNPCFRNSQYIAIQIQYSYVIFIPFLLYLSRGVDCWVDLKILFLFLLPAYTLLQIL